MYAHLANGVSTAVASLSAALLLALWSLRGPLRRSPLPAMAAIAFFGFKALRDALANVRAPHEWDYACFWLYGHVAAAHQNLYEPAVLAKFPSPFIAVPGSEYVRAVLHVGFPYPPPTIALFLPLGYLDSVPVGLTIWYAVQFLALAAAAWLLAREFTPKTVFAGAALVFALVLALPATQSNVFYAQTNYLVLLAVALAFVTRMTPAGAVWQMLAVWIKPYTAALFVADVVRGRGRRLTAAAVTAVASMIAATVVLGPQTMLTYFRSNPSGREPGFTFIEIGNQSLLAVLLRARHIVPADSSVVHNTSYLGICGALVALTVLLCARAPRGSDLAFALCLLLGMLTYPATLIAYGVVLALPLLVLWKHRDVLPGKTATAVALVAAVGISQGRLEFGFGANAALFAWTAFVLIRQRSDVAAPAPAPVVAPRAFAETAR